MSIHLLNELGERLISRDFRGDVPPSCVEKFPTLLKIYDTPVFCHESVHYAYLRRNDLIALSLTSNIQANIVSTFYFLNELLNVFESFVGHAASESVKDNAVLLYELMDEMMDFSYVQTTDSNLLHDLATAKSYKMEASSALSALTAAVSWRPEGIWYKKNELFLDCNESMQMIIKDNEIVNVEVNGKIKLRTFLSGTPILHLGINNIDSVEGMSYYRASRYVVLEDLGFHQCVKLEKFENEHMIEFIPPDGDCVLMKYRVHNPLARLFELESSCVLKPSRIIWKFKFKTLYKRRQQCKQLEVVLPVPEDACDPKSRASGGKAVYAPERQAILWRLEAVSGGDEYHLRAELALPTTTADPNSSTSEWHRPPTLINFEMPGSALSGMHVKYLKIEEPTLKYHALPWVRYKTTGACDIR